MNFVFSVHMHRTAPVLTRHNAQWQFYLCSSSRWRIQLVTLSSSRPQNHETCSLIPTSFSNKTSVWNLYRDQANVMSLTSRLVLLMSLDLPPNWRDRIFPLKLVQHSNSLGRAVLRLGWDTEGLRNRWSLCVSFPSETKPLCLIYAWPDCQ
jgi:hypothetical protein